MKFLKALGLFLWVAGFVADALVFIFWSFTYALFGALALAIIFGFAWEHASEAEAAALKRALEEIQNFDPDPSCLSAGFATDAELEAAGCFEGEGTPLGYSQESGREISTRHNVHRIVFGQTGSGKSTTAIMTELLTWPGSVIIPDSTGELTTTTAHWRRRYGKVLLINGLGLFEEELHDLPHVGFNPLSRNWIDPDDKYTFAVRAQKVASGVNRPDHRTHDPYWANTARQLETNLFMTLCWDAPTNLVTAGKILMGDVAQYAKEQMNSGNPWLRELWGRYGRPGAEDVKSLNEVVETARTDFWPFTMVPPIAQCLQQDDIDFRDCMKEPISIYIVGSLETVKQTAPLLRLGTAHAIAQIMSMGGRGGVHCKLIIDEGFQIEQIDDLDATFAAARKYKLDLFYCLTEHQQLTTLFPRTFDSVIGCCGIRQWVNATDPITSEYLSSLCGEREFQTQSRTVSTNPLMDYTEPTARTADKLGVSDAKNIAMRRLILPHEVRSLGRHEQILFLPGVMNPIRCNRKSYLEIPELARRARQNPFYRKAS